MRKKFIAIAIMMAMVCAMVPATALAGVTDSGDGSINRTTTTNYFTTVKLEIHLGAKDGQMVHSIAAPEVAGNISDAAVQSKIKSMKEDGQAWCLQNGYELCAGGDEGVTGLYYEVHDEIVNTPYGTIGGDQPSNTGSTVTINTVLDRHQTYTITQVVTQPPAILPTFDANQQSPEGTGEFQGLGYMALKGEELVPVDGNATFVVNGATYTEGALRSLLSTLRAGTVVEASFTFQATGDYAGFQDSGSITITIVAAAKSYQIIEGAGGTHKIGTTDALTFRSNADFALFNRVTVDGAVVDPGNYTASEGSTVIELAPKYLDTLEPGDHNIAIVSGEGPEAGSATAAFTIVEADKAPAADDQADKAASADKAATATAKTGDSLPLIPLAIAAASALALLFARARRFNA